MYKILKVDPFKEKVDYLICGSISNHKKDSEGMPLGVQFVAPYGEDRHLIELAYELEVARP